ncbi:MAG: ABC transporter ATP-binding protein, partial [Planctomycetales bacterium]|nr:ABC transporter ATP-binding protein [Planctomycetales bacterium]
PTTGLDPIMSDVINQLILRARQLHHVSSILVTHDMTTAGKVASRVVMMLPTSLVGPGEPQVIYNGPPGEMETCADPRVGQFVRGQADQRLLQLQEGA